MRLILTRFAFRAPYNWYGFATRFEDKDEVVGINFFEQFSKKTHSYFSTRAQGGLMDSMKQLNSDLFDYKTVNELIKDFYEKTSDFDMHVTIKWNRLIRPLGIIYRKFLAERAKQLLIPLDNTELDQLDSWIEFIDVNHDLYPDFRCWIRVNKKTQEPIYIGAYKTYSSFHKGKLKTFVSVSFPIPRGNVTTVLQPTSYEDGGLKLTTRKTKTKEAGVYLIFPHKHSFSMLPAFGLSEEFKLKPVLRMGEKPIIHVKHSCFLFGIRAFEMIYIIRRKEQ